MIYEFPIWYRHLNMSGMFGAHRTLKHVDNLGIFITHNKDSDLSDENIRRHLVARSQDKFVVVADCPHRALEQFFDEPGAKTGGSGKEDKAMWIRDNDPIFEYPDCPEMHMTDSDIICGDPDWHSMCIFDGADPPEECPLMEHVNLYYDMKHEADDAAKRPQSRYTIMTGVSPIIRFEGVNTRTVCGYKFVILSGFKKKCAAL
jgi:hypothetical protein